MILGAAIQGCGENAGDSGFTDAPMSAENIAVCRSSLLDRVLQRAGDVLLSDDFRELLRTVFASQDGITHEDEETIIRDMALRMSQTFTAETVEPRNRPSAEPPR